MPMTGRDKIMTQTKVMHSMSCSKFCYMEWKLLYFEFFYLVLVIYLVMFKMLALWAPSLF